MEVRTSASCDVSTLLIPFYHPEAFSLFSIVQFPNQQCTASSSTTTYGTCYTSSECTTKGGSADGNCAAGFGVCCEYLVFSVKLRSRLI